MMREKSIRVFTKTICGIVVLLFGFGVPKPTVAQAPVQLSGSINLDSNYLVIIQPIGLDESPLNGTELVGAEIGLSTQGAFEWSTALEKPQWVQVIFMPKKKDRQLGASFPLYMHPGQQVTMQLHYSDSAYLTWESGAVSPGNHALIDYSGFSNRKQRALFLEERTSAALPAAAMSYVESANALIEKYAVQDKAILSYLQIWAYNNYLSFLFNQRGALSNTDALLPKELEQILDNDMVLLFYNGYSNISRYIDYQIGRDPGANALLSLKKKIQYMQEHFTSSRLVDYVTAHSLENFSSRYAIKDAAQFEGDGKRFAALAAYIQDSERRNRIVRDFQNLKFTQKGSTIPDVAFKNAKGENVRLQDFAGKYIYIDLWASWCVPCIKEIPYLQELEEAYKNKNIEFVSISLDRDKQAWSNKMQELELKGNQWELGDSRYDKFMNVTGIPHFILYDPQGRLLLYQAPRPNSEAIRELFDAL